MLYHVARECVFLQTVTLLTNGTFNFTDNFKRSGSLKLVGNQRIVGQEKES